MLLNVLYVISGILIAMIMTSLVSSLRPLCMKNSNKVRIGARSNGILHRTYMSQNTDGTVLWPVARVRQKFVEYFQKKHDHANIKSSPVVPVNDPTLLFANAGMNQFKPIFVGTVDPSSPLADLKRAVNSQKCIRAGGKHNDLDDVGKDTYHHTFFEMLGTWSFGNYFKKEAINWAYDILVNEYKLPSERLYASYFGGDESMNLPCDTEARDLWLQYLPKERVLPFDKKANFWEMGDTGPCGPCSEIHFDRIGGRDASSLVNADDPDVIEIWNLVFIQYNRELSGELRLLPDKHIDTGMGLERLTSILQDKRSNYDTDVFMPLFKAIEDVIGCEPYTGKLGTLDAEQNYKDMAYRVVADHIRTLTLAITDGAVPSNEGRGYVLRRILRRAVRYGMQTLGGKPGFFSQLVPHVAASLGFAFPEINDKVDHVTAILKDEEQAFSTLLEKGVKYFADMLVELKAENSKLIKGDRAFFMYDTLGFPVDLTQLMAAEQGFVVDLAGFDAAMKEQKARSRTASKAKRLEGRVALTFGAEQTSYLQKKKVLPTDDSSKFLWDQNVSTKIEAIYASSGFVAEIDDSMESVGIVLQHSPFYAESGGQICDSGFILIDTATGTVKLDVIDVQTYGGYILHTCIFSDENIGSIKISEATVTAAVDYSRRRKIAPNHTMTHVLNLALRDVLGGDVDQKGSLVSDDKFRFDFSSNRGAVTIDELSRVEDIVNTVIDRKLPVYTDVVPLKEALAISGLRAVFGEVYPDPVRVVSVGPKILDLLTTPDDSMWRASSIEFCGGTHISNTKDAEAFVITEETAVAKGIRRVSGITGQEAKIAQLKARDLQIEVNQLCTTVTSGSVKSFTAFELDDMVIALRQKLEEAIISSAIKSSLRSQLESAQRSVASLKNQEMLVMVDLGIAAAKEAAVAAQTAGKNVVILQANIGSDAKAIKRSIDEIKKATSDSVSFLCISAETSKVTVFSYVTESALKSNSIRANDWVSKSLERFGGKGGGKPGMAQGSAVNTGNDLIEKIMIEGEKYIN